MNPKSILKTIVSAAAAIFALLAALPASAQDGIWTNKTSGGLWSNTANWTNAIVADGSGTPGAATFNLGFTANTTNTVHMDNSYSLTGLTFGNATNTTGTEGWILDNNGNSANVLTLSSSPTTIAINPGAGSTLNTIISAVITGATGTGLTKSGAGTLYLTGANTYDGPTTLANNTPGSSVYFNSISEVGSGTPSALGQPTTAANGTIYIGRSDYLQYNGTGSPNTARNIVFTDNNGQIFNSNPNGNGTLTLSGNITNTATTSSSCVFRTSAVGNSLRIPGALNLGTGYFQSVGSGPVYLENAANAFTNYILAGVGSQSTYFNSIANGGQPCALGAGTVMQIGAGAYLTYNGTVDAATDRSIIMQGNNSQIINGSAGYALTLNGPVTNTATANPSCVFRVNGGSALYVNGLLNLGTGYPFTSGANIYFNNPANAFTNMFYVGTSYGNVYFSSIANGGQPCSVGAGRVVQVVAGGYLNYNGTNDAVTDRTFMFLGNNCQLKNPSTNTLTLNGVVTNTVSTNGTYQSVFSATGPIVLNGPVALNSSFLLKNAYGQLYLNNPTNSFTNYVWNSSGSIHFNTISNAGQSCSLGQNGTIYFAGNAQNPAAYYYTGGTAASDRTWTFATQSPNTGPGYIGNYGTGTLTLNGPINAQSATMQRELNFNTISNDIVVNGAISLQATPGYEPLVGLSQRGPFTLTLNNSGNYIPGTLNIFNGTLNVSSVAAMGVGANPGINLGIVSSAYASYTNTTGKFQFTGASGGTINVPINVVADSQGSGTVGGIIENTVAGQTLTMSGAVTPCDLSIPGNSIPNYSSPAYLTLSGAGNGVLSADITGSPILSITKAGTGTWSLTGNNTYVGNTVVSNGTLVVSGTIGGGTTNATVVAGGTLAGIATIADAVNVLSGGTLTPDTNNVPGTMTINSNLVLSGTVAISINKTLSQSNSLLSVSGTVANAGGASVLVNNVGPALAAGNSFQIFNQAVANGAAMTISPAPGAGLAWQNDLAVNGSISVVTGTASYPTNITASVSGNALTLTWPATHLGWILQTQTNALSVGLTTPTNTWFDVVGSAASNTNVININSANPAVFYRLRNP